MPDPITERLTDDARRLYDAALSFGMTESQALTFAAGAGGRATDLYDADPFDRLTETFRAAGMTESAAHTAAVGWGGTEQRARARLAEHATGDARSSVGRRRDGVAALDGTQRQLLLADADRYQAQGHSREDAARLAWEVHDRREARIARRHSDAGGTG